MMVDAKALLEGTTPRDYFIRKGLYFYRPNRAGYTDDPKQAGRYTKAEAEREAGIEPWHMEAVLVADVFAVAAPELAAEVERLRAALTKIAAFDDVGACDYLTRTGSFAVFDEPSSAKLARAALATPTPGAGA